MLVRVALGSDHAGFRLKSVIAEHLRAAGHEVKDLGTASEAPVDYPPFCAAVGRAVVGGAADVGVVVGGSGQGEQIAANKVHGVRAALCADEWVTRLARQHNDANVMAIGARVTAETYALALVDLFLATPFDGGRHAARLAAIATIEAEECDGRGMGR